MKKPRFWNKVRAFAGPMISADHDELFARMTAHPVLLNVGDLSSSAADADIADLTVRILARLHPTLAFEGASATATRLADLARGINPNFEVATPGQCCFGIAIGDAPTSKAVPTIRASAAGWTAQLGDTALSHSGNSNPFGAGAVACLATAQAFRIAVLGHSFADIIRETRLSLLTYTNEHSDDATLPDCDLGRSVLVGAGAVGHGAIWCLSRLRASGELFVVDDESVDESNLQRYVLAADADISAAKTAVAKRELSTCGLNVVEVPSTLEAFAQTRPHSFDIPNLAVCVDNVPSRRAAQALLPRFIANGWTGDGSLGASWHDFLNGPCLACLYHPSTARPSSIEIAAKRLGLDLGRTRQLWVGKDIVTAADVSKVSAHLGLASETLADWKGKHLLALYSHVVCGGVALSSASKARPEVVPAPFQSALAGIMMVAELVKRGSRSALGTAQVENLVQWNDVTGGLPRSLGVRVAPAPTCICRDPDYQAVYREKWTLTTTGAP